jgi:hypothetical protein
MCLVAYFSTVVWDITHEKLISENESESKDLQLHSPIEDENVDLTKGEVPEGLSTDEWDDIQANLQKTRYYPTWSQTAKGYIASNPEHKWDIVFDDGAALVNPGSKDDWSWTLTPTGYGYGSSILLLNNDPKIIVDNNNIDFVYNKDLTGWYINDEKGLEHGFTLASRPQPRTNENLLFEMSIETFLIPKEINNGENIVFLDDSGKEILNYGKLFVIDATGRTIPCYFQLAAESNIITISVDDTNAIYPLIVDPIITYEDVMLTASDGADFDYLGNSVSINGENVVIGAANDDIGANQNQGSAYIFGRNQGGTDKWGEVVKLTASDGADNDSFGYSVFLAGDTLVVGAPGDSTFVMFGHGSVYIFERNLGGPDNWGEVVKITAQDGLAGDYFGNFVSIDGNTLVVGANNDDIGVFEDQGSAYIFDRNQGGSDNWGEVVKITASDGEGVDHFGTSVSISNDTVVVGSWADDIGANMDQGSVYIFERNQGGSDNWGEVKKLIASDGEGGAGFGYSVSITGDTLIIGAPGDDIGANIAQGSVYVLERNQGGADNWGEVVKIIASDGASADFFGISVYIIDDTVAVGADYDDIDLNDTQGSAYVFKRNQGGSDNWGEVTKLIASDGEADDHFGRSVSVSGDIVVVGAPWNNVSANIRQGSAYIYYLNYTNNLPSITTADIITAYEDSLYIIDYEADDLDGDELTWSMWTDAGGWLTIGYSVGVLSGTPENSDVGSWTVNVSVSDGHGGIDFSNFTLTVVNINDSPVIITGNDLTALVDELYSVDYEATDDDLDPLTWNLFTNASWLSIDSLTGVLSGAPTDSKIGSYMVNVSVSDGNGGSDFSEFILEVMILNNAPVIVTDDVESAFENVLYSVDYDATDEDQDPLTWALDTNASWLSLDSSSGILSGTPSESHVGIYSVKVSVSDGNSENDISEFTLTVYFDNDGDGIMDSLDTDDDNDGYLDTNDDFPEDPNESKDTDDDGIGDNADDDDDDDGYLDNDDDFPLDDEEWLDTDGDGKGNNIDSDDDNDGVLDVDDKYPLDSSRSADVKEVEETDYIPYLVLIIVIVIVLIIIAVVITKGRSKSEVQATSGITPAVSGETQLLKCPSCQNSFEVPSSATTITCPYCGFSG